MKPNEGDIETIVPSAAGFATGDKTTTTSMTITDGAYITKDGDLTLDSAKAVGQFTASGTTLTYTESAATGQNINLGKPSSEYDAWSVTTGAGKDTISVVTGTTFDATINSGAGDDEVNIVGDGSVSVSAGDGKDTVSITGKGDSTVDTGAGKDVITASGAGSLVLNGGEGDDKITHTGAGESTLQGGSGKDTIAAAGSDDVVSGGDGADTFDITANDIKINDYNALDGDVVEVKETLINFSIIALILFHSADSVVK